MSTSRRSFIRDAGMSAAGASIVLSGCQNNGSAAESEIKKPIIGHGDFRYELDKNWIQKNGTLPVHHCHEMIMDKNGRLFMSTTEPSNNIIIYDKSGKVLDSWGTEYPGIHGLTYADQGGEEFLYLTDNLRHQVYKTTLDGRVLLTLDYPKEIETYQNTEQYIPTETAIAENGDIYVADGYGLDFVIQYDAEGNYIRHFAGKGEKDHHVANAHGVCIDNRGSVPTVIVTSRAQQSFNRYTMDGEYISTVEIPGCWICRPVINGDYLYFAVIVTKSWYDYDGMIVILDKKDKVISIPGGSKPLYEKGAMQISTYDGGSFLNPHDVCIDDDENIYVPQWLSGRTFPYKLTRVV